MAAHFTTELEFISNKFARNIDIPKPVSFAYPGYDTSSQGFKGVEG